jgi:hypothetical protein
MSNAGQLLNNDALEQRHNLAADFAVLQVIHVVSKVTSRPLPEGK